MCSFLTLFGEEEHASRLNVRLSVFLCKKTHNMHKFWARTRGMLAHHHHPSNFRERGTAKPSQDGGFWLICHCRPFPQLQSWHYLWGNLKTWMQANLGSIFPLLQSHTIDVFVAVKGGVLPRLWNTIASPFFGGFCSCSGRWKNGLKLAHFHLWKPLRLPTIFLNLLTALRGKHLDKAVYDDLNK